MSRPTRDHLRGAAAVVTLLGLLVGVPYGLLTGIGNPLPTRLPTAGEFERALTDGQVATSTYLKALALVVWVAWAQLTANVAAEGLNLARERRQARVPGPSLARVAATNLVGAAALLFGSLGRPALAGAGEPGQLRPTVATAPVDGPTRERAEQPPRLPSLLDDPATGATDPAGAADNRPVWRVKPRQSLWDIAEHTLGDGRRWHEIHALNVGRPQPDGGALRPGDEHISPGWVLLLPDDAQAPAQTTPPDPAAPQVAPPRGDDTPSPNAGPPGAEDGIIIVEEGDTLWALAGEHLGDPHRWPALYRANAGEPQPDGRALTDPDLIYPGWQLHLPDTNGHPPTSTSDQNNSHQDHDTTAPPAADGDDTASDADETTSGIGGTAPVAEPSPTAPRTPPTTATDESGETATQPPAGAAAESAPPTPDQEEATEEGQAPASETQPPARLLADWGERVLQIAGLGLAAAGVVATLDRIRRLAKRRRQAGQHVELPTGALAATEQRLRGLADHATSQRLELALRALSRTLIDTGRTETPPIVVASVSDDDLALHLARPEPAPPAPWRVEDDGASWVLPHDIDDDTLETQAHNALSVAPLLVSLGARPTSGCRVLLNLTHARLLGLDAGPETRRRLLTQQALELATTPRATALTVVVVGFGEHLVDLERLDYVHDPRDAPALMHQRVLYDPDVPVHESDGVVGLFATPPDAETMAELTRLVEGTEGAAAAVVPQTAGTTWWLTATDQHTRLEPWGLDLTPLELGGDELDQAGQLLVEAKTPTYIDAPEPQLPDTENPVPAAEAITETASPTPTHPDDAEHTPDDDHQPPEPEPRQNHDAGNTDQPPTAEPARQSTEHASKRDPEPTAETQPPGDDGDTHDTHRESRTEPAATETGANDSETHRESPTNDEPREDETQPPEEPEPSPADHDEAEDQSVTDAASTPSAPTRSEGDTPVILPSTTTPADTELAPPEQVEVRVLGTVEIAGAGAFGASKAQELVIYLALHREGADHQTLLEALWPEQQPSAGRLHTLIWRARQALGTAPDGTLYLPKAPQAHYRLSQQIRVDYERFQAHRAYANAAPDYAVAELTAALELVRGRPLAGTPDEYTWAHRVVFAIEQEITETAHRLAQLHLEAGRPDQAVWAADRGLTADPYDEPLYRDLLQAAAQMGNRPELDTLMQRLARVLDSDATANDGHDWLHPETVRLYHQLRHHKAR